MTSADTMKGTRAAQYVRISTEHQQFCNPNQANKIREYAERRGIAIVYTYADEGNLTRSRWISTTLATRFTAGNNSPCSTPATTPTSNSVKAGVTFTNATSTT